MANNDRLIYLLNQALEGAALPEELQELTDLIEADKSGAVVQKIEDFLHNDTTNHPLPHGDYKLMLDEILEADKPTVKDQAKRPATIFMFNWRVAAALFILLAGTATFVLTLKRQNDTIPTKEITARNTGDRLPGSNKAMLRLADGSTIVLDSASTGTIASQGVTKVLKLDNGQLAYNATGISQDEILYNTVSTPRGGQYQVILPDGSKVWLNAASSLHFPTAFTGRERKVELTGEAYFEIAKNPAMPFTVSVNDMTVQVLGTHFNVMAYGDEAALKTTLLEGSVKITGSDESKVLKPGQQAVVRANNLTIVNNADVEEAIAWKNGFFQFNKVDVHSLMRQISRWYDVEIVYQGEPREHELNGKVDRNIKLSSVVEALKQSGIHCRIEDKKLIVLQ